MANETDSDPAEARKRRKAIIESQRQEDEDEEEPPKKRKQSGKKKTQIRYDPDVPMEKDQLASWRREQRKVGSLGGASDVSDRWQRLSSSGVLFADITTALADSQQCSSHFVSISGPQPRECCSQSPTHPQSHQRTRVGGGRLEDQI